jgi:cytolethal distending toxin subunit A
MRAIFISYRREDAEGQAGRLFNDLAEQFGEQSVFMDVAGIEPGRDFRKAIDEQVASCGVLLAVIGKRWLDAKDETGRRRLDDPMDFVRLETASAMKRSIPVIPVLVQGASMPRAEQLPADLAELSYRNGVELTHARWDSDVQVLVKALRPHVGLPSQSAKKSWPLLVAISVAAIAIAVAIGGYVVYKNVAEKPQQDTIAEAEKVNAGSASGASVVQSPVAPNGNANIQVSDGSKQDQTNNRRDTPVSSATLSPLPQPSKAQQITNEHVMLVNAKTDKCLTIAGGVSTENNVEALQFDCDGDPSRSWIIRDMTGSGVYQIRNVLTGKCLTIAGGMSTDNNVTALQFDCDSDPSRTWRIRDVAGNGLYQIKNVQTGKCLTIAGGVSTDNNVRALQFDCDTDLSRRWTIRVKE